LDPRSPRRSFWGTFSIPRWWRAETLQGRFPTSSGQDRRVATTVNPPCRPVSPSRRIFNEKITKEWLKKRGCMYVCCSRSVVQGYFWEYVEKPEWGPPGAGPSRWKKYGLRSSVVKEDSIQTPYVEERPALRCPSQGKKNSNRGGDPPVKQPTRVFKEKRTSSDMGTPGLVSPQRKQFT
jgi:hypothetical protein